MDAPTTELPLGNPDGVTPLSTPPDQANQALDGLARIWNHHLLELDGAWITPGRIIIGLAVFAFGLWIARLTSRILVSRLLKGLRIDSSTALILRTLAHYCLVVVVLFFAFQTAGIPLTAFTIFGGALAIGIGFGSQNILNNFISGLIMLLERPIKPGDLVQIGDRIGVVQKIGARATQLTDYRGISHLVPNSHFLEQAVTNWHYTDDLVCATLQVGVAYGSDVALVRQLLHQVATDNDAIVTNPEPQVLFNDFGNDALAFELLTWTHARRVIDRRKVESDLRFALDAAFRTHNICIAFPQRDVHIDTASPIPVRVMGEKSEG
jgi:potassium-dependent mechanosensitive channel